MRLEKPLEYIESKFQNLIGMLGRQVDYCNEGRHDGFQNLIGMLGSLILILNQSYISFVSKPYRYARKT